MANRNNSELSDADGNVKIQAFKLVKGQICKTTGSFDADFIYCNKDGNITLKWNDGTTQAIDMVSGMPFTTDHPVNWTVNSGEFHYNIKG